MANIPEIDATPLTTISGVWVWNDTLSFDASGTGKIVDLSFTSNNVSFTRLYLTHSLLKETVSMDYNSVNAVNNGVWTNEAYKTMDLGSSPQEVNQDFYDYLTANATKQEEPVVPTTTKTVSSDNLARFKQKCDETYAKIGDVPSIPTPTTSDNGKVLGVTNGVYALQEASGGGTKLYRHELSTDQDGAYSQYMYVFSPTKTGYSSFADAFQDYHAISYKGVIQLREGSGVSISYKRAVILGFDTATSEAILYDTKENVIISMTGAEIDANVSFMGDGVWDIDKP